MDALLQPPVATAFDAISSTVSAVLYLAVALAALARAPRDTRTRVFLATAVASAAPYMVTALLWTRGTSAAFNAPVITLVTLSLMMGSLALLHFTQVYPWRRPWIRSHGVWLRAGYVVTPINVAAVLWLTHDLRSALAGAASAGSGGVGAVSAGVSEVTLLVLALGALPVLFALGIAAPFAGLLSLYKSWKAAAQAGIESARVTTFWMLISQLAGGVLTILIIPLLRLLSPTGPWVTIAAALLFAVGLLMPIAFALGVWKYQVLELDPDAPPLPH